MSVGPVSGNGIAVSLPPGKTAFWTATTQASYNQFVQLKDSGGNVVFTASGASLGGHSPTQIGSGGFVVDDDGNYMLYIGVNNGASWSNVLWDDLIVYLGQTIMCSNFNFIAEDGADQDYNDIHVSLTWFARLG